ncbi:MAG: pkd domain containing protein, partial [Bacteroidetes bacterium HGW-Bacteroidetes-21]
MTKMKHVILTIICFLVNTLLVFSQDCNITSKANDILPDRLCAPVSLSWEVTYRGVNDGGALVEIVFNWDDGNAVQVELADNTNPNPAVREWSKTVTHIYPQGGNRCNYRPTATLRINGILCTSTIQQQNVTVWDTDIFNGGQIAITPQIFPICVGNDGTVVF